MENEDRWPRLETEKMTQAWTNIVPGDEKKRVQTTDDDWMNFGGVEENSATI